MAVREERLGWLQAAVQSHLAKVSLQERRGGHNGNKKENGVGARSRAHCVHRPRDFFDTLSMPKARARKTKTKHGAKATAQNLATPPAG